MVEAYVSKESLFNSSFESLRRIQDILTECNRECKYAFCLSNNSEKMSSLKLWWVNLKNLYKEIHAKLSEKERRTIDNLFSKVSEIKLNTSNKKRSDGSIINEIDKDSYTKKWNGYWKIEVRLRHYATKRGLLLKDKEQALAMMD